MSDYKPITGELRKYATVAWDPWPDARDRLYQMCDRIDAIHAQLERENAELRRQLDSLMYESRPMTDENMAEHGWVCGPIGADGKPMAKGHMVVDDGGDVGVIVETSFSNSSWSVLVDFGEGVSVRFVWFLPKSLTHYHKPTVEDVLHEFVGKALCVSDVVGEDELVTEYAAKVREVLGK